MSKISQKQELQHKLTPQQILQAKILQLTAINLEQRILSEIESNPALELEEVEQDSVSEEVELDEPNADEISELDEKDEETDFDWEEILGDPDEYEHPYSEQKEKVDMPLHMAKTITDSIMEQLNDLNLSDVDLEIAEQVIGNLDEHGYLTIEPILISDRMMIEEESVLSVMEKIRHLDPPGLASQTIRECLLAQLKVFGDNPISTLILDQYFEDFTQRRYEKIIKSIECTTDEFNDAISIISQLNPHPGEGVDYGEKDFVIPDVCVEERDGDWIVTLNDSSLPEVKINKNYKNMLREHSKDKEVIKFVNQKIESAEWFIDAINQRRVTIVNVVEAIIKYQSLYFDSDQRQLKPMVLKDVADKIGVDISTVSRVTNGRFVQLPWEIKELKSFFTESILMKDGSEVSNSVVKDCIKEIIKNEDKSSPFGDEDLMKILKDEGYEIARRTVSKYRDELKIPVARLRKHI